MKIQKGTWIILGLIGGVLALVYFTGGSGSKTSRYGSKASSGHGSYTANRAGAGDTSDFYSAGDVGS
jgi:hypothetical protein